MARYCLSLTLATRRPSDKTRTVWIPICLNSTRASLLAGWIVIHVVLAVATLQCCMWSKVWSIILVIQLAIVRYYLLFTQVRFRHIIVTVQLLIWLVCCCKNPLSSWMILHYHLSKVVIFSRQPTPSLCIRTYLIELISSSWTLHAGSATFMLIHPLLIKTQTRDNHHSPIKHIV